MSLTAPRNTVAYQLYGRPLSLKRKMDTITVGQLADAIDAFRALKVGFDKPETNALWFYLGNHAMREVQAAYSLSEPLPPAVLALCEKYHQQAALASARAMYYLAVITAREARHLPNKEEIDPLVLSECGSACAKAMYYYKDSGEIENTMTVFRKWLGSTPLTSFVRSIQIIHYEGAWGGGFGGKKWGKVTDCLYKFVTGEFTAEMMLDTVWTLSHNNGPIFNKGMLYSHYDANALKEILDVQRAGQIPRLMYESNAIYSTQFVTPEMRTFAQEVGEALPRSADFKPQQVNWKEVMALGALGNYQKYADLQPKVVNPTNPGYAQGEEVTLAPGFKVQSQNRKK